VIGLDAASAAELWSATSRHDPRFAARFGTDLARPVVGPDLFITRVRLPLSLSLRD
jgi:hypothetical protein